MEEGGGNSVAPSAQRLPAIEGLRAIAAVMVLFFHLQGEVNLTHPRLIGGPFPDLFARLGPFGVAIFFCLSGFLLYRPYALATLAATPFPRLGPYYVRRFLRIFPAYWVALGVLIATANFHVVRNAADFVGFFALLQNYRTGYLLLGIGVAWTLVIEVSFYLVLPVLAVAFRGGATRSKGVLLRRQLIGVAVMGLVAVAVRVWTYWFKPSGGLRYGAYQPLRSLTHWLPGYLDWFAIGMALAVGVAWVQTGGAMVRPVRWMAQHAGVTWLVAIGGYVVLAFVDPPRPGVAATPTVALVVGTALPLLAGLLVLPIALAPEAGGLRTVLRSRPFIAVGMVSYGIYLWHQTVIRWTRDWMTNGVIPRSALVQVLLVVTITGVLAALSYFVVERPFMQFSARWTVRRRHALVATN